MNPKKQKALAALLACPDRKTAAEAAGVTDRTLRSYFHDPEFLAAYKAAYDDMLRDAAAEGKQLLHADI